MDNKDNNNEMAERFLALVRKQVIDNMANLKLETLTDLMSSLASHVALRDLYVANGIEVDPEVAQMADAAVYFLCEAGLTMEIKRGKESHE